MQAQILPLKGNHKKRVLVLRMGGLGDCLILTTVCKQLHKLGYSVHYYMGSPTGKVYKLFDGLEYIEKSREVQRVRGIDSVEDEEKHLVSIELIKPNFDIVLDYKNSIEDNRVGFNKVVES